MNRIASAIGWLAVAVFMHGCMSMNITRIYLNDEIVKSEKK